MATTLNAKGVSAQSFTIGKKGTTLYQGSSVDPNTVQQGSFWFDSLLGSLRYKGTDPSSWKNLVFDDISFSNNSIISVSGESSITLNGDVVLNPGSSGNALVGTDKIYTEADNGTFDAITLDGVPASGFLQSTVGVIAGNGLSGGGNLSQNRTINAVAGDGIIVTASDIAVDNSTVARLNAIQQTFSGDVVVTGDLTVQGNTDVVQRDISTGENIILLNADWPTATAPTEGGGIFVYRGNTGEATTGLIWDEANNKWIIQERTGVDPSDPGFPTTGGGSVLNTYDLWHSGNVGPGSGLDADTVDGIQGSDILRNNADIITANQQFIINNTDNGLTAIAPDSPGINLQANGMNTTNKFTSAVKFISTDSQFLTENPKLLGWIAAEAKQTYSSDNSSKADIVIAASPAGEISNSSEIMLRIGDTDFKYKDQDIYHTGNFDPLSKLDVGGTANDSARLDGLLSSSYAKTATSIVAGNGLTGGGTLDSSKTFNVGAGTGISVTSDTVDLDTTYTDGRYLGLTARAADSKMLNGVDSSAFTLTSRSVSAGNGLTGGGNFTANRTLNVGAGLGITVAADTVSLDTSYINGLYLEKTNPEVTGQLSLASGVSGGVSWENGQHVMTNNDGGGNFNFRLSNIYSVTNVATSSNCTPFHQVWSNDSNGTGTHAFKIGSGQDYMVNDPISWNTQIEYDKNYVRLSYSGSKKFETTSSGAIITGELSATEFNTTSSIRYKENVHNLDYTSEFDKLRPVSYNRKDSGKEEIGFIAEEVNEIIPEVVQKIDGIVEGIDYSRLTAVLTAKVQSQDARIAQLEQQLVEVIALLKD